MAAEDDDSDAAASRLEAALDRIARATAPATGVESGMNAAQVAARLDSLIGRLRAELGGTA